MKSVKTKVLSIVMALVLVATMLVGFNMTKSKANY